jgi:hypothetical protein
MGSIQDCLMDIKTDLLCCYVSNPVDHQIPMVVDHHCACFICFYTLRNEVK